jgi:hypothetical protein
MIEAGVRLIYDLIELPLSARHFSPALSSLLLKGISSTTSQLFQFLSLDLHLGQIQSAGIYRPSEIAKTRKSESFNFRQKAKFVVPPYPSQT